MYLCQYSGKTWFVLRQQLGSSFRVRQTDGDIWNGAGKIRTNSTYGTFKSGELMTIKLDTRTANCEVFCAWKCCQVIFSCTCVITIRKIRIHNSPVRNNFVDGCAKIRVPFAPCLREHIDKCRCVILLKIGRTLMCSVNIDISSSNIFMK